MRQPKVLFVICDDLAYGDLSCHGNPHLNTPRIDALAAESTRVSRYCSGPLCTPARAALMTGRHPYRTRAIDTYVGRSMLDPDEVTLPRVLKAAGYETGLPDTWRKLYGMVANIDHQVGRLLDLLPVLRAQAPAPDRAIGMQWHRGDVSVRFRNAAMITARWKWVRPAPLAPDELYDIPADPGEAHNLAGAHPDVVAQLAADYERWFDAVGATRTDNYAPPRLLRPIRPTPARARSAP